jgi:hypothetical protein
MGQVISSFERSQRKNLRQDPRALAIIPLQIPVYLTSGPMTTIELRYLADAACYARTVPQTGDSDWRSAEILIRLSGLSIDVLECIHPDDLAICLVLATALVDFHPGLGDCLSKDHHHVR